MLQVKISDFKSHLSEYIKSVRQGGVVVVLDRYSPVARLMPYADEQHGLELIPASKKNPEELKNLKKTTLKRKIDVMKILSQERAER